jgi:hypothetical protein
MKLKSHSESRKHFFTRAFLDLHQLHDVLLGHLVAQIRQYCFQSADAPAAAQTDRSWRIPAFVRAPGMTRLIGNNMNAGTFTDFNIAFDFQHDDRFTNHGAADAFFIGDKALGGKFITHKIDTLLDALFSSAAS